jgi:hypothetical protein
MIVVEAPRDHVGGPPACDGVIAPRLLDMSGDVTVQVVVHRGSVVRQSLFQVDNGRQRL